MKIKCLLPVAILLIINHFSFAASTLSDSTKLAPYQQGFHFKSGVYLTIEDWKRNNPIPKSHFITEHDTNAPYFFVELLKSKWLEYQDEEGIIQKVEKATIFGYSVDNLIFNKWHVKIPIIGSICHYTKIEYKSDDPFLNGSLAVQVLHASLSGNSGLRKREKFKQFIINFETGKIYRFKKRYFKKLIITDVKLYNEYKKYKGSKKDKMYIFLKKYNERHPIYFSIASYK